MNRRVVLVVAAAVLVFAAGCGSVTTGTQVEAAPSLATGCAAIDQHNGFGQTVCITRDGLRPAWLVSTIGRAVTWRNETSATVQVVFDAVDEGPGTIPPVARGRGRPPTRNPSATTCSPAPGCTGWWRPIHRPT